MKSKSIDILAIQESRQRHNTREARNEYTWYFSGENPTQANYVAGTAWVIANHLTKAILDIEPINDRLTTILLNYQLPIKIINVHCHHAERTDEEKEKIYDELQKEILQHKHKGPVFIVGDFNARIQKAMNREERTHIGQHTFDPNSANPLSLPEDVFNNRHYLIDLCEQHDLKLMNTCFRKQNNKLATYRKVGAHRDEAMNRTCFEQIDYVATTNRWKNAVVDVEADTTANINSDHYPIVATLRIKLKALHKHGLQRKRYKECTEEQRRVLNQEIHNYRSTQRAIHTNNTTATEGYRRIYT